jgi:hypothetical protein
MTLEVFLEVKADTVVFWLVSTTDIEDQRPLSLWMEPVRCFEILPPLCRIGDVGSKCPLIRLIVCRSLKYSSPNTRQREHVKSYHCVCCLHLIHN